MKPICVPCQRFYHCKQNGFSFVEQAPITNDAKPGTAEPENWEPYKLWSGDLYECEGCGAQIVSGVAKSPIAEHYESDFAERVLTYHPTLQVNDC